MLFLFTISLLVLGTFGYDHDLYKNCSRVPLCNNYRSLTRQERYKFIIEGAVFTQGVATLPVQDLSTGDALTFSISAIKNGIFRIQFQESTPFRYQNPYMLNGEPEVINFDDIQLELSSATIVAGDFKIIVQIAPISVSFYTNDSLQVVLEGDRLSLQSIDNWYPFTFGVRYPSASKLYGLHEHADHLFLRTTEPNGYDPYRVRTMDLTYYEIDDTQAMYGAIPLLYAHGNGTTGLFVNNAAEQWVEITDGPGPSAFFMVDSGVFDLFFLLGPTPVDAARQYVSLTGLPQLPPIWALGYHQSRWGYWDQTDLQTTLANLVSNNFPVDVIWLDIQYTDDFKFFTWNSENFSTPLEMMANLSAQNRYVVTLTDPHFKKEAGYFIYDTGIANDYFIKNPNGTVYEAECWPGTSVWLDYLNPEVREYYSSLYRYTNWNGTTPALGGIWNDMNEAAVFNTDNEKTFPYDVVHYGGVPNRDIHNTYGLLQTMSTYDGLIQRDNGTKRPFILSRAHTAGSQRYTAIWTGDNTAEWGFIPLSYSMCLNAALSGISFCGADIGGFWNEPTEELLQRFYQSGAWLPFFREHSGNDSARREPYLYPENVQNVIRQAMRIRYDHLPYWYTLFYEMVRYGDPVIRPLWYHYPDEESTFEIDDQLLAGRNVLVKAISEPNVTSVEMYFPGGEKLYWYSAHDDTKYPGTGWTTVPVSLDNIPVFYRQGSIIPMKITDKLSTAEMEHEQYYLKAFLDFDWKSYGRVYIDDTFSFQYQHDARYNYIEFETGLFQSVISSSIDVSNSDGFDMDLIGFDMTFPYSKKDGTIGFQNKKYKLTESGKAIKISGKGTTTINLIEY